MLSVNIVDFRKNLAEYLKLAEYKGESISIVDGKRGEKVAELNPPNNEDDIGKLLKETRGMLKKGKDKGREELRKADIESLKKRVKL